MDNNIDFNKIVFRIDLEEKDKISIADITRSSKCFSEKEVLVAVELAEERIIKGDKSGYHFIIAECYDKNLGYISFGPDAGTENSYHIYWIAVDNKIRSRGIGGHLLEKAEVMIKKNGGRHIYIETSSRDCYIPARSFYGKNGYKKEAVLEDFYGEGDSKVIYSKKL